MLAEYEGYVYIANIKDEQVTLLTYDQIDTPPAFRYGECQRYLMR